MISVVLMGTLEGVWVIDITNARAMLLVDLRGQYHSNNCSSVSLGSQLGPSSNALVLYTTVGLLGIIEIHPNGQIFNVGIDRDDGLPAGRVGAINGLVSSNNYLYASVGPRDKYTGTVLTSTNNYGGVFKLKTQNRTWHHVYLGAVANMDDICAPWLSGLVGATNRLYFWATAFGTTTSRALYLDAITTESGRYEENQITSTASGYVVTPWFTGGLEILPKVYLACQCMARNLSANATVQLMYALNDAAYTINTDTNFTSLAIWTAAASRSTYVRYATGSAPAANMGLAFDKIRFKIKLTNSTGTPKVGTGPVLLATTMSYIGEPPRLSAWQVTIYNDSLKGVSDESFKAAIDRIASSSLLVSFYPSGVVAADNVYYVRISTLADTAYDEQKRSIMLTLSEIVLSQDKSTGGIFKLA